MNSRTLILKRKIELREMESKFIFHCIMGLFTVILISGLVLHQILTKQEYLNVLGLFLIIEFCLFLLLYLIHRAKQKLEDQLWYEEHSPYSLNPKYLK